MADPLDWENQQLTGRNRLRSRAYFFGYATPERAARREADARANRPQRSSTGT